VYRVTRCLYDVKQCLQSRSEKHIEDGDPDVDKLSVFLFFLGPRIVNHLFLVLIMTIRNTIKPPSRLCLDILCPCIILFSFLIAESIS
jgi:hypothetical protein